jgi:hypothetical protein
MTQQHQTAHGQNLDSLQAGNLPPVSLEHEIDKWTPLFAKRSCSIKRLKLDRAVAIEDYPTALEDGVTSGPSVLNKTRGLEKARQKTT